MRLALQALAFALVVALSGGMLMAEDAPAKPKKDPKPATSLKGDVVKVEGTTLVVKIKGAESNIATYASTAVSIYGQDCNIAALKAGMKVTVTPIEGTAAKIVAVTPKPKAEGENKDGAEEPAKAPKAPKGDKPAAGE